MGEAFFSCQNLSDLFWKIKPGTPRTRGEHFTTVQSAVQHSRSQEQPSQTLQPTGKISRRQTLTHKQLSEISQ